MFLIVMMAGRIQLFRALLEYHRTMGVYSHQPNQKWSLNSMNWIFIIAFAQLLVTTLAYFLFQAKSADELGWAFYIFTTETTSLSYYLVQIGQISNTVELIGKFEKFIQESKSRTPVEALFS